jgi:hypothetical protein
MTAVTAQLVIALIGLVLEKGLPTAMALMNSFDKEEITLEDIQALKELVKPPEEY